MKLCTLFFNDFEISEKQASNRTYRSVYATTTYSSCPIRRQAVKTLDEISRCRYLSGRDNLCKEIIDCDLIAFSSVPYVGKKSWNNSECQCAYHHSQKIIACN